MSLLVPDIELVDAHCHLDLFPEPKAVAASALSRRVHTIAVTNAPSVFSFTQGLAIANSSVYPAIGLHPELVESHGQELSLFWPHLNATQFVGEIGLDYVKGSEEIRARQRRVFETIVRRCSEIGGKVMSIHSRRSVADVIAIVGGSFSGTAILHWFSGSSREVARATEHGFWFSVNPAMVASARGRALIADMPRDRILTETDGPFVLVEDRPATPPDVAVAVQGLAEIWNAPMEEVASVVLKNFRRLLAGTA